MKKFLLLLSLLLTTGLACNFLSPGSEGEAQAPVDTQAIVEQAVATVQAQLPAEIEVRQPAQATEITVSSDLESRLIALYEQVNPSVIYILSEQDTFDLSSGSGFVYDEEGYIVTNNHVVTQGDSFEVVFANGSRRRAELIGTDVDSDLAVVKVDGLPEGVEPVTLGDFNEISVGQFVVAIGNPFGEQGSISLGIVSGLGRSLTSERMADGGGTYSLPEVIQTDAPINPGNSGGPLLNLAGEVVGVNSAIRSTTGFNSGVGFSIPVQAVKRVVPDLIDNGEYVYPYLGISTFTGNIDLDRQQTLELSQATGVYVTSVTAGGPAEDAGIIPAPGGEGPGGDLITAIDGQEVREFNDLISYLVFETEVGQTVELTVVRDGERITVPLTLGARP